LQDINQDKYTDITLYDKESCTLQAVDMINQTLLPYRSYRESVRDLGSSIKNIIDQQQDGSDEAISSLSDQVSDITKNQDLSAIPGLDALKEKRSRGQSFGDTLLGSNGNISFNLNLNAFDQQLDSVNKNIDTAIQ
jgi:hypothetical protein